MDLTLKIKKFLKFAQEQASISFESSFALFKEYTYNYLEIANNTILMAFDVLTKHYPTDKNIQRIIAEYNKNFKNIKGSVDIFMNKLSQSKSLKDMTQIYNLLVSLSNYVRGDVSKYLYKIPGYGPVYFASVQQAFSKFLYSKNQLEQFLQ